MGTPENYLNKVFIPLAAAIKRGEAWLLDRLPDLRRATPQAIYNVWAHAYGLKAMLRLEKRAKDDSALQSQIAEVMELAVYLKQLAHCRGLDEVVQVMKE